MPTKLKRITISLTPELVEFLDLDAASEMRPVATHITWIAEQYRLQRTRQAELLNQKQSRDGKAESYVYDALEQSPVSSVKPHGQARSGKQ